MKQEAARDMLEITHAKRGLAGRFYVRGAVEHKRKQATEPRQLESHIEQ